MAMKRQLWHSDLDLIILERQGSLVLGLILVNNN